MRQTSGTYADHLARAIQAGAEPESEAASRYADWLKGAQVPAEYQIAFDTYSDFSKRVKLDSLLMGGCPDNILTEHLGFSPATITVYRELFFDTAALHTDIDKLVFAERYYKENTGSDVPAVDNLVLRGYNQGYPILLLQFCNIVPENQEAVSILKRAFAGAVYKAAAVQYTGMGSAIDKRAIEYCQLAVKLLESMTALKKEDTGSAQSGDYFKVVTSPPAEHELDADFDKSKII